VHNKKYFFLKNHPPPTPGVVKLEPAGASVKFLLVLLLLTGAA
jgi:hypothetical protein